MPKYPITAYLNAKGLEQFGDIFKDGEIPIINPMASLNKLRKEIYLVNIPILVKNEPKLYDKLIENLAEKFNNKKENLDYIVKKNGLPIRSELVSHVALDPRYLV
jgi:hypothetical protein